MQMVDLYDLYNIGYCLLLICVISILSQSFILDVIERVLLKMTGANNDEQ